MKNKSFLIICAMTVLFLSANLMADRKSVV